MILKEEVFSVGTLLKTHGTNGEFAFSSDYDIFDELEIPFIVLQPEGLFVPFYIEEVRMQNTENGIIKLERIESDQAAAEYTGMTIFLPKIYLDEIESEELDAAYFIGFTLIDAKKGVIGKIVEIDDATENVLFVVENDEDELLIPAADEFVVEMDHDKETVIMDLPLGLLEL